MKAVEQKHGKPHGDVRLGFIRFLSSGELSDSCDSNDQSKLSKRLLPRGHWDVWGLEKPHETTWIFTNRRPSLS